MSNGRDFRGIFPLQRKAQSGYQLRTLGERRHGDLHANFITTVHARIENADSSKAASLASLDEVAETAGARFTTRFSMVRNTSSISADLTRLGTRKFGCQSARA
jgi:hypothetical protein